MAVKQNRVIVGLLLGLLLAGGSDLHGQRSPFDSAHSREAALILERVDCFTDRSLYISGETIRFRAMLHDQGPSYRTPWSRVLYVELVSAGGEPVNQGKYEVLDGVSSGEIRIPADLLSGPYYLKCYTRWMRNRGAETFCYVPLRMINPLRSETVRTVAPAEAGASLTVRNSEIKILEFDVHAALFGKGDSITMQLPSIGSGLPETIRGCITVVPRIARPADHLWDLEAMGKQGEAAENFHVDFLPDRYGPSVSGSVVYPDGADEERRGTKIHITLLGKTPAYFVCSPETSGRFTVALPFRKGDLELFVQPENPDGVAAEVRIDQDFDQNRLRFHGNSFALSLRERQMATIMARNVQLSAIYQGADFNRDGDTISEAVPFYGLPTLSVDLDRYVLLPKLEEVLVNLVSSVTPVTRKNRTTLKIESENPAFSLFDPLIMVDQVPVFDMEKFMAISPSKIRRIDVIEDVYVIGDQRFGGLINLQSREMDMAGMDLPGNSFFIDYRAIAPTETVMQNPGGPNEKIPDTRNTLFWSADIMLHKGSQAAVSFKAPDYPGEYVVMFRGIGPAGELLLAETFFEVMQ